MNGLREGGRWGQKSHLRNTQVVQIWRWIRDSQWGTLLDAPSLPRARSPRQKPKNPRQRLCRGQPSAKSSREILSRQREPLPRALYQALGKAFAEGQQGPRQRKTTVTTSFPLDGVFAEGHHLWPSAKKICRIFFEKIFAEGYSEALGKDSFFAEGYSEGPRQRPNAFKKKLIGHQLLQMELEN